MRQPLVVGNWKMNGDRSGARALANAVAAGVPRGVEVAVLPPMVHIADVSGLLSGAAVDVGAQNVADADEGAYTGEVSASMLAEFGCRYALAGHSERREHYGESDALVGARFRASLAAGVTPILCVGESLAERDAGKTAHVIARQIDAVVDAVGAEGVARGVVAYEPVWAIGTGRSADPESVQAVHAGIRRHLAAAGVDTAAVRLLYGGSVKPGNAAALFSLDDVDGGLIGGASLNADDFLSICRAAVKGDRTGPV
ncbi:Triosephosphate isomerase [wastewater metagenome]|uniref:triose-phosphate isomerase n=2 Tax=unclassified sequences TaxID=12908 RepID=A0A5B8R805_9ZZZZ|nr:MULTISPECIES: triose-phosphate isomerase [Arhodomonas]QEA04053.1 triosephosphate isomerase [uncultured organism]